LLENDFVRNFHIRPSHILHRVEAAYQLPGLLVRQNFIQFGDKRFLIIDRNLDFDTTRPKISIDLLLISGNPKLRVSRLAKTFQIKQIVFDGSNSFWKLNPWKKDCDSLHIPFYNVSEKGAFVMNVN